MTGPTGSGKSTTLYMILEELAKRSVNISTIEDPVEKNVPKLNQMQVNNTAGLTFEVGLRALLRQDPDIIMVGETRDADPFLSVPQSPDIWYFRRCIRTMRLPRLSDWQIWEWNRI
jgi:Tfp pilus assembly pilus retraction ATPase PilT